MADDRSVRAFLRALSDVQPKNDRSAFLQKLAQGFFADCLESGLVLEEILEFLLFFLDTDDVAHDTELCERKSFIEHLQSLRRIDSSLERSAFLQKLAHALQAEATAQGVTNQERLAFISHVLECHISYSKRTVPPSRNS